MLRLGNPSPDKGYDNKDRGETGLGEQFWKKIRIDLEYKGKKESRTSEKLSK